MNEIEIPEFLTIPEVAKILQISERFAYLLAQRGEIPNVRMGRSVRVKLVDLQWYIKRLTENGQAQGTHIFQ